MQKAAFIALIAILLPACHASSSGLPDGLDFTSALPQERQAAILSSLSFSQSGPEHGLSSQNASVLLFFEGKLSNSATLCGYGAKNCSQNVSVYINEDGNFIFAGAVSIARNASLPQESAPVQQFFPSVEKENAPLPIPDYWPLAASVLAVIAITAHHFIGRQGY